MPERIYKDSAYNIDMYRGKDGRILIYNGAYGKTAWFTPTVYSGFRNKSDIAQSDTTAELIHNKFIVPQEYDEFGRLMIKREKLLHDPHPSSMEMTIATTSACNMHCVYCFEEGCSIETMSDNTERLTVEYIINSLRENNNCKSFHISWYGGEPLLDVNRIVGISRKVIDFCKDKGIKYSASLITNGLLLSADVAEYLRTECCVFNAQVSIDGLAKTYSKQKRTPEESFYTVIKNIKEASAYIKIDVRINTTKHNANEIIPLFHLLFDENPQNITAYIAIVREYNGIDVEGLFESLEYEKLKRTILKQLVIDGFINRLHIRLGAGLLPCTNLKQSYALIGPDGHLYTCLNHLGRSELSIGDVSIGFYGNELSRYYKNDPLPDKCSKCYLFPACSGLCPDNRRNGVIECSSEAIKYRLETQFYLALVGKGIIAVEDMPD